MPNEYMQPWFDSLSQGVQVAEHLKQAALQQQQLDQERQAQQARQGLMEREFQSRQQESLAQQLQNGAQRVDGSGNVSVQAPTAQANTQQQTVTAADGMPMLQGGGGSQLNFDQTKLASVPGDPNLQYQVGGQMLQAPSLQDQLTRAGEFENAKKNADREPINDDMADFLGLPKGAKVNPDVLARGQAAKAQAAVTAAENKQPKLTAHTVSTDDKGNQTLVRVFDDGTVKETPLNAKGKSDKYGNPEATAAAIGARALTANAAQEVRNKALADYQRSTKEESQLNLDRLTLGNALKNGEHYVDQKGNFKDFDKAATPAQISAQQDNMRAMYEAKTKRLEQVIAEKNDAMQRYGTTPQVSTSSAVQSLRIGQQPQGAPAAPGQQPSAAGKQAAPAAPAQPKAAQQPTTPPDQAVSVKLPNGQFLSGPRSKIDAYLKSKGYSLNQ